MITSAPRIALRMSYSSRTPGAICSSSLGTSDGGPHSTMSTPNFASRKMSERATRLCAMSPIIATRSPSSVNLLSNIVRASSSACVGCSCVPSPAFTIGVARCRARKCGAPDAPCRITIACGRIATSVFSVSTSDSPFDTLEPEAVIDSVSAPRCRAAISKLDRVRVDASKNRLTTILPRQLVSRG